MKKTKDVQHYYYMMDGVVKETKIEYQPRVYTIEVCVNCRMFHEGAEGWIEHCLCGYQGKSIKIKVTDLTPRTGLKQPTPITCSRCNEEVWLVYFNKGAMFIGSSPMWRSVQFHNCSLGLGIIKKGKNKKK